MAKKAAIFKKSVVGAGVSAVMSWTAIEGGRVVSCDSAKIPAATQAALYVHGLAAKVGDAAALQDATVAEKMDAMEKVIAALYAGEWRGEREAADSILLDALCEFNAKKTREQHATELKTLDSDEKLVLRTKVPAIKKIYDRMIGEKAAKSSTKADDLLKKFAEQTA